MAILRINSFRIDSDIDEVEVDLVKLGFTITGTRKIHTGRLEYILEPADRSPEEPLHRIVPGAPITYALHIAIASHPYFLVYIGEGEHRIMLELPILTRCEYDMLCNCLTDYDSSIKLLNAEEYRKHDTLSVLKDQQVIDRFSDDVIDIIYEEMQAENPISDDNSYITYTDIENLINAFSGAVARLVRTAKL